MRTRTKELQCGAHISRACEVVDTIKTKMSDFPGTVHRCLHAHGGDTFKAAAAVVALDDDPDMPRKWETEVDGRKVVIYALDEREEIGEEEHADTDQIVHVERGSLRIVLRQHALGDRASTVGKGQQFTIPRGTPHTVVALEDGTRAWSEYPTGGDN